MLGRRDVARRTLLERSRGIHEREMMGD